MAKNKFCGIYVHGYDKPFSLEYNYHVLYSFRKFSEFHPFYVFYAVDGDISEAVKLFSIIPIKIAPMMSISDYDDFMMRTCFHIVEEENTLTMHWDGFLLKSGWEEYAINYDYIGASWHLHIRNFDSHYKKHRFAKFSGYKDIVANTLVGNGGFCFRKRSKMLEVERSVDWDSRDGDYLPDDVFYSFYGFGQGIFKPVSIEEAEIWSEEPYRTGKSYGFHRCSIQTVEHFREMVGL